MPTCTRYAKTTRQRCTREAAEWPGHRRAPNQPAADWPDLPRVVACWTHLTDDEREQCQEARRRQREQTRASSSAQREQDDQAAAARRAAGIPDPEPVIYEARRCINECISRNRRNGASDSDSAAWTCANCDGYVCLRCGTTSVDGPCLFCRACGEAEFADWEPPTQDETDRQIHHHAAPPTLRGELNALVSRIVKSGGLDYPKVQLMLNQKMGIRYRGEASAEQLRAGMQYAEEWLTRLDGHSQSSPFALEAPPPSGTRTATPAAAAEALRELADSLSATSEPMAESVLLDLAYTVRSVAEAAANFVRRQHPEVLTAERASEGMTRILTTLHDGASSLEAAALSWGAEVPATIRTSTLGRP